MNFIIKILQYVIFLFLAFAVMLTIGFCIDNGGIGIGIVVFFVIIDILVIMLLVKITKYGNKRKAKYACSEISSKDYDTMDGLEFEHFCAELLKMNGFYDVAVTQGSGDYGVDIIAKKDTSKYAIQCKRYSSNVGNKAVQEVYSGKEVYGCDTGIVLTNQYFTRSAIETANKTNIILWDRNELSKMIRNCRYQQKQKEEKKPKPRKSFTREEIVFIAGLIFIRENKACIGLLMRKLRMNYNSALELMQELEKIELIGKENSVYDREILMSEEIFEYKMKLNKYNKQKPLI